MDQDKLNLVTAFRKRDGLMTKPFKEIIPQKKINIYSAPASLSNQSIKENLEKFGEVHDVKNNTTDDDPITSMMDREVHMVVLLPIPSYILVDKIRVKIEYEGQEHFCKYCSRSCVLCLDDPAECRQIAEIAEEAVRQLQCS